MSLLLPSTTGNNGYLGAMSNNSIISQCMITGSMSVIQLVEERNGSTGAVNRIGKVDSTAQLSAINGEMAFVDLANPNHVNLGGATTANGFTSFNGLPIISSIRLDKRIRFIGTLIGDAMFENEATYKSGVAVRFRGSGTILSNNGVDVFMPGDMIGYKLPPTDPKELEAYTKTLTTRYGTKPGKIVAVPRLITPKELTQPLGVVVSELLNKNSRYKVSNYRKWLRMGKVIQDPEEEVAYQLKQFILMVAFNTLIMAGHAGLVDFTKAVEDINKINGINWTRDASEATKISNVNFAKSLARNLGLVEINGQVNSEQTKFTLELLQRSLGCCSREYTHVQLANAQWHNDFGSGNELTVMGYGNARYTSDERGKIQALQRKAGVEFAAGFGCLSNLMMKSVIGVATNVSARGGPLHYYI